MLRQFRDEAQEWKLRKTTISKMGMFGSSKTTDEKDLNLDQLMTDIAVQISSVKSEKESKAELSASDFTEVLTMLVKMKLGQEKEISVSELRYLVNFNEKLEASGGDPKVVEKINKIINRFPTFTPPGGPAF